jgi:Family of unknown function (DUF5678)
MILTAEEVLENVRSLPNFERERFFKLVDAEKNNNATTSNYSEQKGEKFRLALNWIHEHRQEFDGQFVLLDGDKLLAHGKDAKPLYAEARSKGIETPLVHRVKANELPFGGW